MAFLLTRFFFNDFDKELKKFCINELKKIFSNLDY